ncbi:phage tail sheath family protein [Niameybacter massiliensis]|uniref:Phage tail sheath family protein n=1 Tax=Holtiella tumoricola TaxID=3018743 RepID=A0AA42J1Q3_9FIRM|nr:phage tail sheath family protein [Holtiella tumoricola]MDA3732827.1 phage tail sheath family protein [Holtiella tumoricola]
MSGYRHGVYVSEVPTSLIPPVEALAGLPVVVGTAPIHLAKSPKVNEPVLCYTYKEAVEAFGYSDDFESYTLCEFMKSHFTLFSVAPVVLINVLDATQHKEDVPEAPKQVIDGEVILSDPVITSTLIVKGEGDTALTLGEDYEIAFNGTGELIISIIRGSLQEVKVAYKKLTPNTVISDDIIGGISGEGKLTGLELVNEVLPRFGLVPGQLLSPKFSTEPTVAAVMVSKASNINGYFKCMALTDIPVEQVGNYSEVAQWKTSNNYVYENQIVCWPKVRLGDAVYHMSTQLAGLMCKVDASHDGVPYVSPSNHNLQINGLVGKSGKEVILGIDQANYLNGQGIVTAINFSGGWKAWGNRTSCYPSVTDPKDAFISVKRMFYWIGTTIIQTFWQKVDGPITRRLVDTVIDSVNIWLNGLTASGYILGGRVEFLEEENPSTAIMDGKVKFHLYVTPPSPAREMDFVLEYDVEYLKALFA